MGSQSKRAGSRHDIKHYPDGRTSFIGSRRKKLASGQFGGSGSYSPVRCANVDHIHFHPRSKRPVASSGAVELVFVKNRSKGRALSNA